MDYPDKEPPISLSDELVQVLRELAESPDRSKLGPVLGRVVCVQEYLDGINNNEKE